MPADLRYVKSWPPRAPSPDEAGRIVAARRPILARHRLRELYPAAAAVMARFEDLLARKATAAERKRLAA